VFRTAFSFAACTALWMACSGGDARAQDSTTRWNGPFGGAFSANFSVVSDYSFAGISQTNRQPAFQPGLHYRTPSISEKVDLWAYLAAWGSNIDFAATGPGIEVDILGGIKFLAFERRLTVDIGYVRYLYPGVAASYAYEYGDFVLSVGYDFDIFQVNGRVRYSPNSFGASGNAWNKRGQFVVPMPFLSLNENISFKVYGTLGNQYVDLPQNYGIPNNDYWYWQAGLVVTAYGVDITVAYTDTNIDYVGCGYTTNCQGRLVLGVSKSF
jgi:uncharacterized protein (TIGR02001 family)